MKRLSRLCALPLAPIVLWASVVASTPDTSLAATPNAAPAPAASSASASKPTPAAASATTAVGGAAVRSILADIAARVAAEISAQTKGATVCTAPLRSDEPAPRAAQLAVKVATLVAGQLSGATTLGEPLSLGAAQTSTRRTAVFVYVQTEITAGQVRVTADVYRGTRNVWDRARSPLPTPIVHAFATGRIDGEVRSYLQTAPLVGARIERVTTEDRDVIALACGDTDDDGVVEIVTLGRRKVAIGRARGGRFVAHRSAELRSFSGIAPAPQREPIGGIALVRTQKGRPLLDIGLTDRARGVRLDGDLRRVAYIGGVPVATPSGDTCLRLNGSTLATRFEKCAEQDATDSAESTEAPVDTLAIATFVSPTGKASVVTARRDPRTGNLTAETADSTGNAATTIIPRAGAQVGLADLDQDGAPEIVSTLDVLGDEENAPDAVVVTTWEPDGSLREKVRTPVPSGVRALAVCPPETGGASPIVVATAGELWILR